MAVSVRDVLTFHRRDRRAYEKVIAVGRIPEIARNVVALFLWLELIGIDVITYVIECKNRRTVLRFVVEAESILACLRPDAAVPPSNTKSAIPLIAALISEPLGLHFFHFNREIAVRGLVHILDRVGTFIFDDNLYALLEGYEGAVRASEEESRRLGVQVALPELPPELAMPYSH
ncbi:hypothetical protein COCNU_10G003690 [Cocos nucifera]|uniref:Uncharacterized protein n=1 Tax=Cocos nucifera TaxID=13894 RepID=A0A8K0ILH4_COCNU|nr:hypothetical protein COCNU_10G003690 [Cocos nucifera]